MARATYLRFFFVADFLLAGFFLTAALAGVAGT